MNSEKQPVIIACKALEQYFRLHMPAGTKIGVYDISLHVRPKNLKKTLQEAIAKVDGKYDPIYLGYGLCSLSIVGLRAQESSLVVFTADDCIGIFMGHHEKQRAHALKFPGSYFLCRGWIGDGNGSVFDEHQIMTKRYGIERANRLMKKMLFHYTRLVHIVMPDATNLDTDRDYAKGKADQFGLEYVELYGTDTLIQNMVADRNDSNIMSFAPGEEIVLNDILNCKTNGFLEVS